MQVAPPSTRILFLDWLRGLAAVIMLQGHTFHAFLRTADRESAPFYLSMFLGGQAAAIFLFLTGVTFGLGMNRREHLSPLQRVGAALKRSRYLFLLAILFRLQTWAFAYPRSSPRDLLRVDVLNLMGATAAVLAILALTSGVRRFRWAFAAGLFFAAMAPLMGDLPLRTWPAPVRDYFIPNADGFSMFPWGSFFAFGAAAGSAIPLITRGGWNRVMQWAALVGAGGLIAGQYFGNLPYSIYPHADYWLNSPALIACKMAATLLLASGAYLWTEYFSTGFSWVRQLGVTSLPVYWVHIELVYGRWFSNYREQLTPWQCVWVSIALTAAMVAMSIAITRIPWRNWMPKRTEAVEQERIAA